ncbi:MAG TPA: hypothetical protein VE325_12570 [Burkholderiales bacterium]|nr:hypothetical protein [Burkholderiales bacterium]
MRKLLVLAAAAASFGVSAQTQVDAPGRQQQANPASQQAPMSQTEEERIRAEGAAGGTRPVPPEKRKAVGAGAGPHLRKTTPPPKKLPKDQPVEPAE